MPDPNSPDSPASPDRDLIARARRQIEAVVHHKSDQDTLASDNLPGSAPSRHAIPPADSIPGYEISREIHRGGQGVVYLALQKSTRRRVAVKVMKEGPFAGTTDRARFEREVQILGQLQHPNIVTIHESGTAGGNFFFVMDYISGKSLDQAIPPGRHPPRETLQLFVRIAEAVNAAHLRGVIHRDLKPGNVRIDPDGEPHILDFGLAKVATEVGSDSDSPALMTMTGQFVGSLPWASPEQASGDSNKIDIRTDVYSLGVMLYQMLTGRFPYTVAGNMRDVLDNILRADPQRPATIRREIDDEVETIVLKCLHKDRGRRYQTAGELARDLKHYLAGEPIEAKRDSSWYVMRKTLKRYRVPAAIVAAFSLLVVGAGIVSWFFYLDAKRETRKADRVTAFLEKTLGHANPDRDRAAGEATIREALDVASSLIAAELADEPEAEARIRATLGKTYTGLTLFDKAETHLRAALELREKLLAQVHPDLATSLNDLGVVLREQRKFDQAEPLLRRAIEIRRKCDPDGPDLAMSLNHLAMLLKMIDRLADAAPLYREALDISRRRLGDDSRQVLTILNNFAVLTRDRGDYAEAETMFRDLLALRRKLLGNDHPDVPRSLHNLSSILEKRCQFAEAESLDREALAIRRKIFGDESTLTANSLFALSITLNKRGDYAEAAANIRECLETRRKLLGEQNPAVAEAMEFLAVLHKNLGQYAEAEPLAREALRLQRQPSGGRTTAVAQCLHNFANILAESGKYDEAEHHLRESLDIYRELLGPQHPAVAATLNALGDLLTLRGGYDEAEVHFLQALAIYQQRDAHAAIEIPLTRAALGRLQLARGDARSAESPLREALSLVQSRCPEEDRIGRSAMSENLARALTALGEFSEAKSLLDEVLATRRSFLGPEHPHVARTLHARAELAVAESDSATAEALFQEALAIRRRAIPDHPDTAATLTGLSDLVLSRNDAPAAEQLIIEALRIYRRTFREEDWRIARAQSVYGACLARLGRTTEAETILTRAHQSLAASRGDAAPETAAARQRLESVRQSHP